MTKKFSLLFLICIFSALNINAEVYEGSCGTNVKYSLDTSTGLLKITGTGRMEEYNRVDDTPWNYMRSYIKSVEISEGVTSIGYEAFYDCRELTSITIPNSLTLVGKRSLEGTAWFDNQPDGLVYVGKAAFRYKGTMPENTSITLEEGTVLRALLSITVLV